MTTVFCVDTAGPQDVTRHLLACDTTFRPRLSSRVDLADYARKLTQNATRFEAWSDNQLIGLVAAYCSATDRGTAFLSNVSVDPAYTRQGIALQLMQSCIVHARGLSICRLSLEVDPAALPAVRLYQTLGFTSSRGQPKTPQEMILDLGLLPSDSVRRHAKLPPESG